MQSPVIFRAKLAQRVVVEDIVIICFSVTSYLFEIKYSLKSMSILRNFLPKSCFLLKNHKGLDSCKTKV